MATWTVILRTAGENCGPEPGRNTSGLMVLLTDGQIEHEVTRVAFDRSEAKPEKQDVPFVDALNDELVKAESAAEVINDLLDEFDRARADDLEAARDKIRAVLGAPSSVLV